MPIKKHKPEQIVSLLRQIEVAVASGKATPQACREAGITEQTAPAPCSRTGGMSERPRLRRCFQ
jgi:hypothetical protein